MIITTENYPNFLVQFIVLQDSARWGDYPFCNKSSSFFFSITSSVMTFYGVDFGYQNSQTLCHSTFSVGIYERRSLE